MITAASEIMAILALADSRADLRKRLGRIVVGFSYDGKPVTAADLKAVGPMMLLLNDALMPNLVQTTEGAPAIVHCGRSPTSRTAPAACWPSALACISPTTSSTKPASPPISAPRSSSTW